MRENPKKIMLRSSLLAAAIAASLYGAQAWAQDADEEEEEVVTEQVVDRIQVTGTLIRRDEFTSASPIQIITAETAVSLGQVDTAEFLQRTSIAQGSTQLNNQFGGFVTQGGVGTQTVSLRGLGPQRTLVLVNGHRGGPAGTRGEVAAFDLNVLPSSIIQRIEILKDGASSIYGSDAVAGVVNIITRRSVDRPELNVRAAMPFESGGETYDISGATGWNFDRGSIVLAGEWQLRSALNKGDRDFLACNEDFFFDAPGGNRIDREDRSINAGTPLAGCRNVGIIAAIDDSGRAGFPFRRFILSPDGVTVGPFPGFRPPASQSFAVGDPNEAFFEETLNLDIYANQSVIARQERLSLYSSADISLDLFGGTQWQTEILFTRRETANRRFRQFFPVIADSSQGFYDSGPVTVVPTASGRARPIAPFPLNTDIKVDYWYVNTGLEGELPFGNWIWQGNLSYTYSDGEYTQNIIQTSRTGDIGQGVRNAPPIDFLTAGIVTGQDMDRLVAAIGAVDTGNTVYDQFVVNFVATGDVMELPAGALGVAVGAEYRWFSIDDQPGPLTVAGDSWGLTGAQRTKGSDNVTELFAEVDVPLLGGLPFAEMITFSGSLRGFDYDSAGSDYVWKAGLNWQVNSALRLRGTKGTSFRAPALFELFLADQTGFFGQLADPCVNWGESTNEFIRRNCAASGVPEDYQAAGTSSGTLIAGGGAGVLEPETSTGTSFGFVLTPTFLDISIAADYFEFDVRDQITRLSAGQILGGCYGGAIFPNAFCDLRVRRAPGDNTAPGEHAIAQVRSTFLNVNQQLNRGVDVNIRYDNDFNFGRLVVETQATWTFEDVVRLFDPSDTDGFDDVDQNARVTRPKLVGNGRVALTRGDWTHTWGMRYVRRTSERAVLSDTVTYFGRPDSFRVIDAARRHYHSFSTQYRSANWSVLAGIDNIFNTAPPNMSVGTVTREGTVPLFATQYDFRGRTGFVRFNYLF